MGDFFDDEHLIGMDDDDGPPPPYMGGGDPMEEEYEEAYLEMGEQQQQQNSGGGAGAGSDPGGPAASGTAGAASNNNNAMPSSSTPVAGNNDQADEDMDNAGFSNNHYDDDATMGGLEGGPPRVIVTDPLKNEQESSAEREKRLYGFERFDGSSEWRTLPKSSTGDTMHATGWKKAAKSSAASDDDSTGSIGDWKQRRKNATNKSSVSIKKSSTGSSSSPDAQLVRFLNLVAKDCITGSDPYPQSSRFTLNRRTNSMPVKGKQSLAVTIGDGSRFFVTQRVGAALTLKELEEATNNAGGLKKEGTLLGVPIAELMRRADALQRKADRRKRRLAHRLGASGGSSGDDIANAKEAEEEKKEEAEGDDESNADPSNEAESAPEEMETEPERKAEKEMDRQEQEQAQQLWVDKHAPRHFSHLLSDERTNREVLRALREWDPYVFNKAPPARPAAFANFGQQGSGGDNNNGSRKYSTISETKKGGDDEDAENKSKDIRPDERSRVLLLSGPSGVGKTTLAHIVAKHAGYRPIEVNASDERSASVLTERVVSAMESTTLNISKSKAGVDQIDTMAGRPNCLILDEIDGADAKSAIAALVEIIRADIPAKGAKSKNKKPHLRRPIIFICNHKYAPALRLLLPYARQFDVMPPSSSKLTARLRSILTAENMSVIGGGTLLHQLVSGTGGDIRSCLYTLQFASARAREMATKKRIKEEETGVTRGQSGVVDISQALNMSLGGGGRGMKDERSDVADTISAVFRKLKKSHSDTQSGVDNARKRDVERILQAVDCFGDNSKALDCLFMNILRVSYVDPTFDRCLAAHEWMSGADVYRSFKTNVAMTNNNEHHAMQKFHIPSAAAAIHLLCRVETRTDLMFSTRQLNDARYQLEANDGLVSRFVEGLSPKARCSMHGTGVVSDFIPFCLWILSAGYGSVALNRAVSSMDILNKYEKVAFDHHVGTLRALGLTYVKADETSSVGDNGGGFKRGGMRLEPEIDIISKFEGLTVKRRKEIPSVLKELLAHGANLEEMRDRERAAKDEAAAASSVAPKAKEASAKANGGSSFPPSKKSTTAIKDTTNTEGKSDTSKTPPPKSESTTKRTPAATSKNFLGIGAAKAKKAKTARKAALVGFDRSKRIKLSHSGSGRPLNEVIKFKYQKGFTQAVRVPCQMEDLL